MIISFGLLIREKPPTVAVIEREKQKNKQISIHDFFFKELIQHDFK